MKEHSSGQLYLWLRFTLLKFKYQNLSTTCYWISKTRSQKNHQLEQGFCSISCSIKASNFRNIAKCKFFSSSKLNSNQKPDQETLRRIVLSIMFKKNSTQNFFFSLGNIRKKFTDKKRKYLSISLSGRNGERKERRKIVKLDLT